MMMAVIRLSSWCALLLAAACSFPAAAHAAEQAEEYTVAPRPPSDKPYESAAFVPARVNEIEALGLEMEEREALAQMPDALAVKTATTEQGTDQAAPESH